MNKFNFYFLFVLILLFSCDETKKQVKILDEDKMIKMLIDLSIIKSINNLNYEDNQLVIPPEEFFILQKYHMDSLSWEKNKLYYSKRPKLLSEIYKRVQDSLEKKIDSLKNLKK